MKGKVIIDNNWYIVYNDTNIPSMGTHFIFFLFVFRKQFINGGEME